MTFERALFRVKFAGDESYVGARVGEFLKDYFPALRHAPKALGGLGKEEFDRARQEGLARRFKHLFLLINELLMRQCRESDPLADRGCLVIDQVRAFFQIILISSAQ